MPRAQKSGNEGRRRERQEARGVACNCCTTHVAISSVCWRASLLYYITKSAPRFSVVCKSASRARRRRPTLRNRRARLSTVAELRQLDKTAASEASRLTRINPDGIVAPLRSWSARIHEYIYVVYEILRDTPCAIESNKYVIALKRFLESLDWKIHKND